MDFEAQSHSTARDDRQIIRKVLDGWSCAEIATFLDLSETQVRERLRIILESIGRKKNGGNREEAFW